MFLHSQLQRSGRLAEEQGHENSLHETLWWVISNQIKASLCPCTIHPYIPEHWLSIGIDNNLPTNAILHTKFIKPPHLCPPTQCHAHTIIGLASREAANLAIEKGLFIEGKKLLIKKLTPEPRQCMKCQRYGHYANKCPSPIDVCARCAGPHKTTQCTVTEETEFKCSNCPIEIATDHWLADHNCPTFIKEAKKN